MTPSLSLETVASRFAHWRENRRNRREPVPAKLQQQVLALKKTYPSVQIISTLKVSSSQLSRWSARQQGESPSAFISLPDIAVSDSSTDESMTIAFPNGVTVTLKETALDLHLLSSLYGLNSGVTL